MHSFQFQIQKKKHAIIREAKKYSTIPLLQWIIQKKSFYKEQTTGFSPQIHRVSLTKTLFFKGMFINLYYNAHFIIPYLFQWMQVHTVHWKTVMDYETNCTFVKQYSDCWFGWLVTLGNSKINYSMKVIRNETENIV